MPKTTYYHVAPRYSGGSPAMVSESQAMSVADDEKKSYERLMDPSNAGMVPSDEALARAKGLDGIVEARSESKGGWNVLDILTSRKFWRGEAKCYKLERGDKLIRIDSYMVSYISHESAAVTLPRVVDRVEWRGQNAIVYLETPAGREQDRLACNKSSLFWIERDEKQP